MYKNLKYENFHSAYRRFDPVRGMDYRIFINFRDATKNEIILKRLLLKTFDLKNISNGTIFYFSFEVVKPLGFVEIVPSPYVTESTRIAILMPTFENQIEEAFDFIRRYEKICMENQDNTSLMLVSNIYFSRRKLNVLNEQ